MKQLPIELSGDTQQYLKDSKSYKELKKEIEMQENLMTKEEADIRNVAGKIIAPTVDFLEVLLNEGNLTMKEKFAILRSTEPHKKVSKGNDSDIDSKPQVNQATNDMCNAISESKSAAPYRGNPISEFEYLELKNRLNNVKTSLDKAKGFDNGISIDAIEILFKEIQSVRHRLHDDYDAHNKYAFLYRYSDALDEVLRIQILNYIEGVK